MRHILHTLPFVFLEQLLARLSATKHYCHSASLKFLFLLLTGHKVSLILVPVLHFLRYLQLPLHLLMN
uniref:Uncharacterized protein n=1 Tax=Panstrongylus lignarius TaxID=156445 RepID=A0A224Y6H7_9HEMI